MARYLLELNYSAEGARGLHKDGGTKRFEVASNAAKSLGGSLEVLYFSLGKFDAICIVDVPDTITAAALRLALEESGSFADTVLSPLLTPAEYDHVVSKHSAYKKPGA
jgi:uncharacterized protein with GYD domain